VAQGTAGLIADQLRERILDGNLVAGEQINEVHVAARLGVSRGPVREAVQRLAQEGLLTSVRNRGTSVVRLGLDDIADIYQGRLAIEREAARVVLGHDPAGLATTLDGVIGDMQEAVRVGSWAAVSRADLRFHQTIVEAAKSRRLSKMFSTLVVETLLCLHELENIYDAPEVIVDQHRTLRDLLCAGDEAAYLAEIDWHLKNSVKRLSAAHHAAG
jgi:DNA-binding GntR family transcriptional regulator